MVHAGQFAFNVLSRVRKFLLDPRYVQQHSAVRAPAPRFNLAHAAPGEMIAGPQLRRAARVSVALGVTPALLFVIGGLRALIVRNLAEHESLAFLVQQNAALSAHP